MHIQKKLEKFQNEFNPLFENEVCSIIEQQHHFYETPALDSALKEHLLSYSRGGKRIRPFLIYYFSDSEDITKIIDICLSIELFHLAALIHDDIMDAAEKRHGAPTLHVGMQKFMLKNKHLGTDIALLFGDIFLAKAFAKISTSSPEILEEFQNMIQRTIRGQYLDALAMNAPLGNISTEDLLARHTLKTAWYTFTSPARLGNFCRPKQYRADLENMTQIMTDLGILFQIRDDIIDCVDTGSGKELFSDIFENQTTWVSLYIKEHYPHQFLALLEAQKTHDTHILKNIFQTIDLSTPYQKEFELRKKSIDMLPQEFSDIKEKAHTLLDLLVFME